MRIPRLKMNRGTRWLTNKKHIKHRIPQTTHNIATDNTSVAKYPNEVMCMLCETKRFNLCNPALLYVSLLSNPA